MAQVANAQLEALRLENRHLRQTTTHSDDLDISQAESHLKDLETAYSSSLKALEVNYYSCFAEKIIILLSYIFFTILISANFNLN